MTFLLCYTNIILAGELNNHDDVYFIYNSLKLQYNLIDKMKNDETQKNFKDNSTMTLAPNVLNNYIQEAAVISRLPKELIKALIKHESNFNINALSHKKAIGLTQLLHSTAAELEADPWDPKQNIIAGSIFLRRLYDKYGSLELALWGYNAGPSRVSKLFLPEETQIYVNKVINSYKEYQRDPLYYMNDG